MKDNVLKGTCPLYRSKFWKQHERRTQKMEKIRTWYNKNGKYDSVFFVNYTEGSKLAKECQKIINNIGLKIKFVEKAGRNLKQELVKSNPFEESKCQDSCEICSHHPKVNCRMREVAYEIKCEGSHHRDKDTTYGGEICRSITKRFDEHLDDIIKRKYRYTNISLMNMTEQHNLSS